MDDAPVAYEKVSEEPEMPVPVQNGDALPQPQEETVATPIAASVVPDSSTADKTKVNGEKEKEDSDKVDSSDCDPDTLIIDERPVVTRKRKLLPFEPQCGFKGFKRIKAEDEIEPLTNPYFNESLFELSGLHQNAAADSTQQNNESEGCFTTEEAFDGGAASTSSSNFKKGGGNSKKKSAGSPKLREYAQYLGLQPKLQFKCSRCYRAGFQSLAELDVHQTLCVTQAPLPEEVPPSSTAPSTNFRVTRKVFLCSACGTYYENWNLFLHMRNVHKRFVCLYCLGMFSQPEKLTLHLSSKHNCVPRHLTEEDFFREYKEPCYLMCCDCETVFGETDNFWGHQCTGKKLLGNNNDSSIKSKSTNSVTNRPSTSQKNTVAKISKQSKGKSEFVEHVTADTQFSNISESANLNEPVGSNNLEDKGGGVDKSPPEILLPKAEKRESRLEDVEEEEEEENQDALEDDTRNNPDDTSLRISIATDNEKTTTNVESELSDEKKLSDSLESSLTKTKESASDEDEMDDGDDSNKSSDDDKSRSPSPCDNNSNFDEDATSATAHPNFDEDLKDMGDFLLSNESQQEDTRKVPKVTLKLPKITQPYVENADSDDSDKLTMEVDSVDCDNENDAHNEEEKEEEAQPEQADIPEYAIAGPEVPITELELEQPLDKFDIKILLQKCLKQTIISCVYCNHARKIAVNGKQLALHAIAEHRFSAVVNSITAEELIPESFVMRIRESFTELETIFFSIESNANEEGVTFSHTFECFQCRYATSVHKELYLHNRKMHAKTILLCIMCKSNFYSYSELICHLCPGIYESQEVNNDISFRCCMCITDDLPSAFRLMVHLRKRHHICDVCLELCNSQSKLSNHVWKHKLHHICYRCGVAYRNKPDITKHLFWKHGTESVLCKKCLQKKWPHVYHFCIPPSTFTCEECSLNFSKAVALKVHKRLHEEQTPHQCTFEECAEKFISKRLLLKHEFKHREPPEDIKGKELPVSECIDPKEDLSVEDLPDKADENAADLKPAEVIEKKPKVDVYDLPELNLSESDTSESEDEPESKKEVVSPGPEIVVKDATDETKEIDVVDKCEDGGEKMQIEDELLSGGGDVTENLNAVEPAVPILENIWDNFKMYQATKQVKMDTLGLEAEVDLPPSLDQPSVSTAEDEKEKFKEVLEVIGMDHDYCTVEETVPEAKPSPVERTQSMDHDYCFTNNKSAEEIVEQQDELQQQPQQPQQMSAKTESKPKSPVKAEKKASKDTSDSSDDSDSSSCECNSNCSCSSSSGSSSSSSDSSESDSSSSEGRRKQQARRERRRLTKQQKLSPKKQQVTSAVVPVTVKPAVEIHPQVPTETQIEESDLYTTESETDEEFYDKQPQKMANKLLMEKRKLLLAGINTAVNGSIFESSRPSTPSLPETEAVKLQKKKSKNKKKKKKNKKQAKTPSSPKPASSSFRFQYQQPVVSPLTLSLPKNSPCPTPTQNIASTPHFDSISDSVNSNDSSKRASKRRRIPNRFYGYSSDEEHEKYQPPVLKWPKADLPSPARQAPPSPQIVPPITIRTVPSFVPEEPIIPRSVIPTHRENKTFHHFHRPPPIPMMIPPRQAEQDSCTETNDSSSDDEQQPPQPPQPPPTFVTAAGTQAPLYCYCHCPYDEVSEMIGCDASDCEIEWFHFECVGIMVPPKGQWYCPDCRKKDEYAQYFLSSTSPV